MTLFSPEQLNWISIFTNLGQTRKKLKNLRAILKPIA